MWGAASPAAGPMPPARGERSRLPALLLVAAALLAGVVAQEDPAGRRAGGARSGSAAAATGEGVEEVPELVAGATRELANEVRGLLRPHRADDAARRAEGSARRSGAIAGPDAADDAAGGGSEWEDFLRYTFVPGTIVPTSVSVALERLAHGLDAAGGDVQRWVETARAKEAEASADMVTGAAARGRDREEASRLRRVIADIDSARHHDAAAAAAKIAELQKTEGRLAAQVRAQAQRG